jgi:rRNA maturation endonuclease Nob1
MLMSKVFSLLHIIMLNVNIVLIRRYVIQHNRTNYGSGDMKSWRLKQCKECGEQFKLNKKSNRCKLCNGQLSIVKENRNIKKLGEVDER